MIVGTVKKIANEQATVSIERQDMCGSCHACEVVGEVKKCEILCKNTCGAKVGDQVEISLKEESFLKATMIIYGLPLVGLILGIALGWGVSQSFNLVYTELSMILGGLLLLTLTYKVIRRKDKMQKYTSYLPQIKKIIKS